MKLMLGILLTLSVHAFATDYIPVPDGFYSGTGTWSDNFGATGTWSGIEQISNNGMHIEFTTQFSDGRQYGGISDLQSNGNSGYTYFTTVAGQTVAIGSGVSSPAEYQATLSLSPTETINEFGYLDANGGYVHRGSISDSQSGRTTFLKITQKKSQ